MAFGALRKAGMRDLETQARELARLEREVVRALVEGDFDLLAGVVTQFREVRLLLAKVLAEAPAVSATDPETRTVLNRLSHGPPFTAEKVLGSITTENEEQPLLELTDNEVDEIGSDLMYSWINHYEYVRNLFRLNSVICLCRCLRRESGPGEGLGLHGAA
jgi:hypothetical protein